MKDVLRWMKRYLLIEALIVIFLVGIVRYFFILLFNWEIDLARFKLQ